MSRRPLQRDQRGGRLWAAVAANRRGPSGRVCRAHLPVTPAARRRHRTARCRALPSRSLSRGVADHDQDRAAAGSDTQTDRRPTSAIGWPIAASGRRVTGIGSVATASGCEALDRGLHCSKAAPLAGRTATAPLMIGTSDTLAPRCTMLRPARFEKPRNLGRAVTSQTVFVQSCSDRNRFFSNVDSRLQTAGAP